MSGSGELGEIPLRGIQLVEASAGTGKTHVIVGLYLRALAVLGLPVDAVLLLSYTVAATAELRLRVQGRLLEALALATQPIAAAPEEVDPELLAILAEARTVRAESDVELAARLARAARSLDQARIHTIHAWARGVAADEALALGLPLAAEFVEDEREAGRQALADAWRAALEDPAQAEALLALGDPESLWESFAPLLLAPGESIEEAAVDDPQASVPGRLRAEARRRLLRRRAQHACYGVDEVLERLSRRLREPDGAELARRLVARHPLVLIDEFQDADARQYAIFRALQQAGGQALLLVGDPKQAIYRFRGGDVETYLAARREAVLHRLRRNWRARPALIEGLNALYGTAGSRAFELGPAGGIRYEPLVPAGRVEDRALSLSQPTLLPAALCFAHLPGVPRVLGDRATGEALLARQAAQLLADWLAAAASGALQADGGPPRIAVLADNHAQLDRLAAALTARGLPHRRRAARQRGLPIEVDGLAAWLAALIEPIPARARALDGSPFAEAKDVPEHLRCLALREAAGQLRREGLVAALQRWLARAGGAEAGSRLLGLAEALCLVADPADPYALYEALSRGEPSLPAEPDVPETGPAVSLLTVHAAKGLEFDLVLLPYAGARARGQSGSAGPEEEGAQRAERLRSLYVALTRARLGVVVGLDLLGSRNELPALYHLLGADDASGSPAQAARRAVEALADGVSLGLMVWPAPVPPEMTRSRPEPSAALPAPPAEPPRPAPALASYSSLLQRADPQDRAAGDTIEAEPALAGAGFGSAVHAVLEHADFAAWAGAGPLPAGEAARLDAILARLPSLDPPAARRVAVETQVRAALNTRLPEGLRLCELPARDRRAELPFTLRLRDPESGAAELTRLALQLRPDGVDGAELRPGPAPVGWLTGIIDLVYRHEGRWYLADWKSNRLRPELPAGPDGLALAVAESGYELQMLLYSVALDRWLAQRLPGYERERHFGGLRWLYLRALDAAGGGIYAPALSTALLEAAAARIGPA